MDLNPATNKIETGEQLSLIMMGIRAREHVSVLQLQPLNMQSASFLFGKLVLKGKEIPRIFKLEI